MKAKEFRSSKEDTYCRYKGRILKILTGGGGAGGKGGLIFPQGLSIGLCFDLY